MAGEETTPESAPAVAGAIWRLSDFQRATQRYGKGNGTAPPFKIVIDDDSSDEERESLVLRCAEPARPPCKFRIRAHCELGSDGQAWVIDQVCEQHTHWQSVFTDPDIRQAAIDAGAREAPSPPPRRTPSPPALTLGGLPGQPDRPLMWSPTTSRSPTTASKKPKERLQLVSRPLPELVTVEEWEARQNSTPTKRDFATPDGMVQGSSKDHDPPLSPSKLISNTFNAPDVDMKASVVPFANRPSSPQISAPPDQPSRHGKMPMRDEEALNAMEVDEAPIPLASPRTKMLRAVALAGRGPTVPDTPGLVQPAFELIQEEARGRLPRSSGEIPPVPAIGSKWATRDAFKDACQAHAGASDPPFGFTTPSSSTSGPVRFLLYACRHYKKGGQGCPYVLRLEQVDANKPDSEWVVTHGSYRHSNHRQASPPPRSGWGTGRLSISGKRPSIDDPSMLLLPVNNTASHIPPPPKRIRAASPPLSRSLPLDAFLAGMHPLLASPTCATSLRSAGVDSAETLTTLTAHELTALLACQACAGLSALQKAVISNRVARHLDDAPLVGKRPGRKPRTVLGCLLAVHGTMFPREGDGALVSKLFEEAGVLDADMLKSMEVDELVQVLLEIEELSELQRIVLVNRIPFL